MKKITPYLRTFITGLTLLTFSPIVNAFEPPPVMTLEERVKDSSHIFIGKVEHQYFVNGLGKRISSAQAARLAEKLSNNPVIQVEIQISEVLLPRHAKMPKLVKFRYQLFGTTNFQSVDRSKGLENMLRDSQREAGKSFIFLTSKVDLPKHESFFASSDDTFYYEPISKRNLIRKTIAKHYLPVSNR